VAHGARLNQSSTPSNLMIASATIDRRHAGIAATVLVHALLILGWLATRQAPSVAPDPRRMTVQWIRLPAPAAPVPRREKERAEPVRMHVAPRASAITLPRAPATVAPPPAASAPNADAATGTPVPPAQPARSGAAALLERARRDAGAVDRALRKENNPYIVAPLDSPEIRMRKKMERAAQLAPNRLWEAPKTEELVNDTGDGARRTRVITPGGAYCITERAPTTSIDMIEKHGKIRVTDCGTGHEQPASAQEWRTARD
jgi:hypothetical protein